MTMLRAMVAWSFGSVTLLAGLAAILDVPFDAVMKIAFVAEVAVLLAYGGIEVTRLAGRVGQRDRRRLPDAQLPDAPTVRVAGEIVPAPRRALHVNPWRLYTADELLRLVNAGRPRMLAAPEQGEDDD